jgi:hypothetical protein
MIVLRKTKKLRSSNQQQGAILLLVLLFSAALATLAYSSFHSASSGLELQRDSKDDLRSELAAEAGLDFARNNLMVDPYWGGTGQDWVQLGSASQFRVSVDLVADNQLAGVQVSVRSEGNSGNGKTVLAMEVVVNNGGSAGDVAAVFLSSDIEMRWTHFNGNILIPDMVGAIEDYRLTEDGQSTWTLNESALGTFDFRNMVLTKTSYQFTDTNHIGGNVDIEIRSQPYKMPAWNLDAYLLPNPGYQVLEGVTEINGLNTDDTLVVVLEADQTLTVLNSQIHGGLVVWAPPTWDLRSGPRNQVIINGSNVGVGAAPHIGLLAPASDVSGNLSGSNFHGLSFWNSIHDMEHAHITGALVVVNEIVACYQMNVIGQPQTLNNLPDGIQFQGSNSSYAMLNGGEAYAK